MNKTLGMSNGNQIKPYRFVPRRDWDANCVAKSLSNICRYNGHLGWMSVAEHCLIVSRIMAERCNAARVAGIGDGDRNGWRMVGLLHDTMESVFGDITTPVKYHPDFDYLRFIENKYLTEVYLMHNLFPTKKLLEELHAADKFAMSVELECLGYYTSPMWKEHIEAYPADFYPEVIALGIRNEEAELLWLEAYNKLKEKVSNVEITRQDRSQPK